MTLQIGAEAPDFEADTTQGRSASTSGWAIPGASVLAPQGLHAGVHDRARLHGPIKPEFDRRNVKIVGLSADPVENHGKWAQDIEETQGLAPNYPMIGDPDLEVSKLYGMLPASAAAASDGRTPADNQTVRNVFVIGPD